MKSRVPISTTVSASLFQRFSFHTCKLNYLFHKLRSSVNIFILSNQGLCNGLRESYYLRIYLWLYSLFFGGGGELGRFFSFLFMYTVGKTPWTGDQPVLRPLSTHRTT
jgi:hypothetical protein